MWCLLIYYAGYLKLWDNLKYVFKNKKQRSILQNLEIKGQIFLLGKQEGKILFFSQIKLLHWGQTLLIEKLISWFLKSSSTGSELAIPTAWHLSKQTHYKEFITVISFVAGSEEKKFTMIKPSTHLWFLQTKFRSIPSEGLAESPGCGPVQRCSAGLQPSLPDSRRGCDRK